MPTQKDLKRLTRSRMKKTGESYTTARASLLDKKINRKTASKPDSESAKNREAQSQPSAGSTSKAGSKPALAELAGMKDSAVEKATGMNWAQWVKALDEIEAHSMVHRDIAKEVQSRWEVSGWWSQSVTIGYERIKGMRELGQQSSGNFAANKSKTFPVAISVLYKAVALKRNRDRWMSKVEMTVSKRTEDKSIRIAWGDGTRVEIYFWSKGEAKSQIQIQHRGFGSKTDADAMKVFWADQVRSLNDYLKA